MKRLVIFLFTSILAVSMLNACGPSEEELQRREQARQDSLEQVRQQELAQQRQDSIAQAREQARQDSIAAAKERNRIEFDSSGSYAVQVEAWRSQDKAEAQVQKWKDRGYENAYVIETGNEDTGNIWYRVRLGRVADKEMAQKLQDKLQRQHQAESWVSQLG